MKKLLVLIVLAETAVLLTGFRSHHTPAEIKAFANGYLYGFWWENKSASELYRNQISYKGNEGMYVLPLNPCVKMEWGDFIKEHPKFFENIVEEAKK